MDNTSTEQFLATIKDLDKRLSGLERTTQPQLIDWYEMNPSLFTYSSDNVLLIDDSLVTAQFFQIGDKIRINQSGYKYFYIIEVDYTAKTLTLNAGDDYTLTNATFTSLGFSRIASPTGHPLIFNYGTSVKIYDDAGNDITANFSGGTNKTAEYSMNGSIVQLWLELSTFTLPANIGAIFISTPFIHRTEMAQVVYNTGFLLAGSYNTGADFHVIYDWRDWVGTAVPGTYPSEAGLEIYPFSLGATYDSGSWWWTTNMSIQI